jgi:glycosyltransferase involved in cell wall biosynthesis
MNILFLTTHFNTGGITSYIMTLGEGLVKSGHKVWVVSSGGDCVEQLEESGMRHVKMDIRTKSEIHPKLWLRLPVLMRLAGREGIDIIHAQTRVTQVLGSALSRLSGIALVTTCHGFFRPRWFRKTFPCWGQAVIAISRPVAGHLSQDFGVPEKNIHLIFNGVDLDRFLMTDDNRRGSVRKKWGLGDTPLIGIIARLSNVKGIEFLIRAMPLVLKELPSASLMIVGRGSYEDILKKEAADLSLTDKVHFKDTINQTNQILCAFDVFVMPSILEGLGLSVMEAQACGVPVIASRVGGLVDLIEDGKSGYLVPSRDAEALADRIIKVLKGPGLAKSMAQQARLNIERHFSARLMTAETVKVYEKFQH